MIDLYRLLRPVIAGLDPEFAHDSALATLAGLSRSEFALAQLAKLAGPADPRLATELFGTKLATPLIAAAGLDKNGRAVPALNALGFGIVEVGTVTLDPQPGNPKPRIFRLAASEAVINRMGFPSQGAAAVAANLAGARPGCFALNTGPNKERVDHTAEDCLAVIRRLAIFGPRYIVLNVSSPNTARLRGLQARPVLAEIVGQLKAGMPATAAATPLLVKVAPDIGDADLDGLIQVVSDAGLEGIVATNTTTRRPAGLTGARVREQGGLSGKPLAPFSDRVIERIANSTNGRLTILAAGGVFTGADVARKIALGATAVQIYTGFTFEGPAMPGRVARELLAELERLGVDNVGSLRHVGAAAIADPAGPRRISSAVRAPEHHTAHHPGS